MTPFSEPVIPAQPNQATYGFQALEIFQRFDRASYRKAFGVRAPAYDPARPLKAWFDTTAFNADAPDEVRVYRAPTRLSDGKWAIRQMIMSALEAANVNLPGREVYDPYVVAPTRAMRMAPGNLEPQPVNADELSTVDQVSALTKELGAPAYRMAESMGGGFSVMYPPDEPRRMWEVIFQGRGVNAGILLKNRHRNGVDAPGHWDLTGEEPVWVPAEAGPDGSDAKTERAVPVRDLLPNERIVTSLAGPVVTRTDLTETPAAGGFAEADRTMLRQIHQILSNATVSRS